MKRDLKKTIRLLVFLSPILWAGNDVIPSSSHFNFEIQSHFLKIQIDPPNRLLKAEDQIEILLREGETQILSLILHSNLRITKMVDHATRKFLSWREIPYSEGMKRLDVFIEKANNSLALSISYEGSIYDPVVKEKALQFVRGDETSGLIAAEGVYLSSSSHWYPDRPGSEEYLKIYPELLGPFPCFNALLKEREKIFVVPEGGNDHTRRVYVELATMTRERKGGEILTERELTEDRLQNSSLMLLGESWQIPLFSKLLSKLPSPMMLKDSIFFYGWESYVLFTKGRPEKKGSSSPSRSFVSHNFMGRDDLNKIQPLESKGETMKGI
ncbi:MAG: hypothetical protein ACUVWO_04505 [Thermodesulfobacteriota bacterium]